VITPFFSLSSLPSSTAFASNSLLTILLLDICQHRPCRRPRAGLRAGGRHRLVISSVAFQRSCAVARVHTALSSTSCTASSYSIGIIGGGVMCAVAVVVEGMLLLG
jgi:hypothetical protein